MGQDTSIQGRQSLSYLHPALHYSREAPSTPGWPSPAFHCVLSSGMWELQCCGTLCSEGMGTKPSRMSYFWHLLTREPKGPGGVTELAKHLGARKRTLGNGIVYFPARSAARTGGGGCDWGCSVKNWPGLGFMFYSWGTIEFFLGFLFPTQLSAFPQFLHHRVFLSLPFPPSAEFGCSVLGLQ